ncbi:hypothetical protein [Pigmentiphaga daeguensis]|uniref:Uncharacterized protein n=1 Tax=Pigmentiphaga daeguensis TaxID=414049 RepID=A0ABN1BEE9_9BURK
MTSTVSFIVGMIVGMLFGGTVGVAAACICVAARDTDDARPEDDRADTAALGAMRGGVTTNGRHYQAGISRAFVNYNPLDVLKELSAAMGYHGAVGYCIVMSDYMRQRLRDTIAFHGGALGVGRQGADLRKQGGYINLDGLFLSLVTVGAIAVLAVVYGGPWAWDLIKPWLHEVTR